MTDKSDRPPIFFAASRIVCDVLLDSGADIFHVSSTRGETCLHVAAANGASEVVDYLIGCGVPVDCVDAKQYTPLHKAARRDFTRVASILLDQGADCGQKTIHGQTPIDVADAHGHNDMAFYLYCRYTGSNKVPLKERLHNPMFMFGAAIFLSAAFTSRDVLWDVFLDFVRW